MSLISEIERLITEHGSAQTLKERVALWQDKYSALEQENAALKQENAALKQENAALRGENDNLKTQIAVHDANSEQSSPVNHVPPWMANR
ncbi:MAG: hypothetical protein EKK46_00295 [Rhodocyclaceae bacterium]|nr:MAG: hypothetical protein EKK46_00295 [Rhodocyclaceae bacterium]